MDVLSQSTNAKDALVAKIAALCENQISDMRHGGYDAIHSLVRQIENSGEVQIPDMFKHSRVQWCGTLQLRERVPIIQVLLVRPGIPRYGWRM